VQQPMPLLATFAATSAARQQFTDFTLPLLCDCQLRRFTSAVSDSVHVMVDGLKALAAL